MSIPIFVVSILNSPRRTSISDELKGEKFEFIDAVIGKNLAEYEINKINQSNWVKKRYKRNLALGEIGCSLSHREIYKNMLHNNIEWAIILEDDVFFKFDFFEELNSIYKKFNVDDLFILGVQEGLKSQEYILYSNKKIDINNDFYFLKTKFSEKYIYRTAAYMISKSTAKKILDFTDENFCCADDWSCFKNNNLFNDIYLGNFVGHPEDLNGQSLLEKDRKMLWKNSWKDKNLNIYNFLRFFKIQLRKIIYGAFK